MTKHPTNALFKSNNKDDIDNCSRRWLWPGADTILIMGGAFAAGTIGGVIFAGSALYGYYNVYGCKKANKERFKKLKKKYDNNRYCTKAKDCTLVKSYCGKPKAINKYFIDEHIEEMNTNESKVRCLGHPKV